MNGDNIELDHSALMECLTWFGVEMHKTSDIHRLSYLPYMPKSGSTLNSSTKKEEKKEGLR